MNDTHDDAWKRCTWEGKRRAQIRYGLSLTLRQRMQAVEEMADLARHFEQLHKEGKFTSASQKPVTSK